MLLIFVTCLLVLVLMSMEKRTPFLKDPPEKARASYLNNFKLFIVNDLLLSVLSIGSLFFIAEKFSGFGLLSAINEHWLKQVVAFLLLDLVLYLWHRIDHMFMFLWSFHQVHHSDACLNVSTSFRFHIGALVLGVLVKALFIVLIGVDAMSVVYFESIITLFVIFQHGNISFPGEKLLAKVFIVPRLHRVHHSLSIKQRDKNFGIVFSFWDRLFGTYQDAEIKGVGLSHIQHLSMYELTKLGFNDAIFACREFYQTLKNFHLTAQ